MGALRRRVLLWITIIAAVMAVSAAVVFIVIFLGDGGNRLLWLIEAAPPDAGADYGADYLIGRGMADVTGPVVEINMMGYVKSDQNTEGIHLRLYSRAFIVADLEGNGRVVFVCVDAAMIPQLLKIKVMSRLHDLYGDVYTDANVLLTATHTHSGPGGYMQYVMYQFTSLGFYKPSLDALVEGVLQSIKMAHGDLVPGRLYVQSGHLYNSSVNRSPLAYLNNPAAERDSYPGNTDTEMIVLKLTDLDGAGLGMINWFSVHATSMNHTNKLISSDNKGYASLLFEEDMDPGSFPGQGPFVAAFAQSNHGDISPNTRGPRCRDTGETCDVLQSTCGDQVKMCTASGPGEDMFESTRILAQRQYKKAKELYNKPGIRITGPIDFRLRYVNMTSVRVQLSNVSVQTCKPAIGFSTAAGTMDGPGEDGFTQGDLNGDPFIRGVLSLIQPASDELVACHAPKPILMATGEITHPYTWQAEIVDFQIFRIGDVIILGVPAELSTMSGRRIRKHLLQVLLENGYSDLTKVVITGMANSYMNYIATAEEYQVQRYEGASTAYGPHTLAAVMQVLSGMAEAMAKGEDVVTGQPPPNLENVQVNFNSPVIWDGVPLGKQFGLADTGITPVKAAYKQGETVQVSFHAGNPRNSNPRTTNFLTIEKLQDGDVWLTVRKDSHWDTRFRWERTSGIYSLVHITWNIPTNQEPGTYRIRHDGHRKRLLGGVHPYSGHSPVFELKPTNQEGRIS